MEFKIISAVSEIKTIAVGKRIREIVRLRKKYGDASWRKVKGTATIRLPNGRLRIAELHWYEARNRSQRDETKTIPGLKR